MASNGGVSQLARVSLIPMMNLGTGQAGHYAFDPLFGFNDPSNPSVYSFRVEDVITGRTPNIINIILSYRDLGRVTVTFSLSGTQDDQIVNAVTMPSTQLGATVTHVLGNVVPTNKILTKFIAIQLTAQNLQLTITRRANAGPLSITKLVMCGKVENQQYAG
jgi:hypothetical protein